MECSAKYIKLSECERVLVYKIDRDGKPIFSKQFLRLWKLLSFVGVFIQSYETTTLPLPEPLGFPLPGVSLSKLTGVGQATSPGSIVRLITFENANPDGPIGPINSDTPYLLNTYNVLANYEVKWKIRDDNRNKTKIGFYTSNTFDFYKDNKLKLISGDKGVCLFTKNSGSFICEEVQNMYIAVDQDVLVDLEVRLIIPEEVPPLPRVYTKCITIYDNNCCKHKVPIFTVRPLGDPIQPWLGIKEPTKCFRSAAALIGKYLDETALSIKLFDSEIPATGSMILTTTQYTPDGIVYSNPSMHQLSGRYDYVYDYSYTTTVKQDNKYYAYDDGYKIPPQYGFHPKISYIIQFINTESYGPENVTITLQELREDGLMDYHEHYSEDTGAFKGAAATTFTGTAETLVGSFVLSSYATDFIMVAYTRFAADVRFHSLTLSYVYIPVQF